MSQLVSSENMPLKRFHRSLHIFMLLVLEDLCRGLGIIEELIDLLNLLPLHTFLTLNTPQKIGRGHQLHCIPGTWEVRGQYAHKAVRHACTHRIHTQVTCRSASDIPEGGLVADLCQVAECFIADINSLSLSTDLDDLQEKKSKWYVQIICWH